MTCRRRTRVPAAEPEVRLSGRPNRTRTGLDRRTFLAMLAGAGVGFAASPDEAKASRLTTSGMASPRQARRYPLPDVPVITGERLSLVAGPARVDVGPATVEAWTVNGHLPSPTIRLRRGDRARIDLENRLDEPTILHWHGLTVPAAADGHPRLAVDPGGVYRYEFDVIDRAGTYWYHPHTHRRTGPQTYLGMGGLLLVEDDEEDRLELPSGPYEIPLVLQDKRLEEETALRYELGMGPDRMMGFLGDTAFANGVADPTVEVERGVYRLRILNGSNARIFHLEMDGGPPFTLIGGDGGLLEAAVRAPRLMLGTGERVDVLVDFSEHGAGERITLRSRAFDVPGMMMGRGMGRMGRMGRGMRGGMMMRMGGIPQGAPMDLVEFVVTERRGRDLRPLPETLSDLVPPAVGGTTPRRSFRFRSMMMSHTINDRAFELERVDERVPLGRTEVWSVVNDSELPHPVHVHVGPFRVLSRTGGRGRVMPWETGLKDTVLVFPGERVDLAVRFEHYPGLFLLHCHNLEHEDQGMMLNFEVEA